jgi:hypothetical protein
MITNLKLYKAIRESMTTTEENGDELLALKKDTAEKLDGKDWEIAHILDIIQDPKDIEKYEKEFNKQNETSVNTDLNIKSAKPGQTLYLSVLLAPRTKSIAVAAEPGVIQVRVQQVFYGLGKLSQLKQAGKLFN